MSEVIVAKFGGSSLADSKQFLKVKNIVLSDNRRRYVVPSAPGKRSREDHKITDLLYLCHQHVAQRLPFDEVYSIIEKRYLDICTELGVSLDMKAILTEVKSRIAQGTSADYAASRGEYLNGLILADYLGYEFIDAAELIVFDKNGQFDAEATQNRVQTRLASVNQGVIPGFYGAMEDATIKTFSRGGSDVTGAIIARGVAASVYENWTDVSGFCMADPRIIEEPKLIEKITYKELRELSYMGASVLHEEAIFPVKKEGIPIKIKNTNKPQDEGTLILSDLSPVSYSGTITGIAGKKGFTVIAIEKMLMSSEKGFFRKLLSILEGNDISVEHMPSSIDSVSLVIADSELGNKMEKVISDIHSQLCPESIVGYPNMALIAVVGRGMIKTKGISAKVFGALAQEGINVRMITQGSSELNIIVGIENEDFEKAIKAIYKNFIAKKI
ncbi:MAG: aspartate kinase [Anaerosolibacter sp.]|jgi:aspartate kinase|uniref:aspartate kinase n=1 Tax=Anaerosolibacter sp. TaxID=1872527 RepID=UPI0026115DC8|nr:aspartate kinase [Anaerosolibacter sp.]MDF2546813.1 aspartate kinase [Anaerosolibacter sp.]